MARAVVRVMQDPEYGARIGEAGRALVCERFGWDRAAESLAKVCEVARKRAALLARREMALAAAAAAGDRTVNEERA